jgi:hypothetical protein
MSIFVISFRIKEDSTYQERYDSLVERIKKNATGSTWEETTSFFLIESTSSSSELCDDLYYNSKIIDSKDVLLVVNLSHKSYAQKGAPYPKTLDSLMGKR